MTPNAADVLRWLSEDRERRFVCSVDRFASYGLRVDNVRRAVVRVPPGVIGLLQDLGRLTFATLMPPRAGMCLVITDAGVAYIRNLANQNLPRFAFAGCRRKHHFISLAAADSAIARIARSGKNVSALRAMQCEFCRAFRVCGSSLPAKTATGVGPHVTGPPSEQLTLIQWMDVRERHRVAIARRRATPAMASEGPHGDEAAAVGAAGRSDVHVAQNRRGSE
jgi:hypothetical protein